MEESYINSIYYQIRLTSKYLKKFTAQMFEKLNIEISFEKYIVLELLSTEGKMCQRDLAKLIFKDRANTGRICNDLKEKGYINILVEEKNNRPVKNLVITEKGEKYLKEITKKMEPLIAKIRKSSITSYEENLKEMLKNCREFIKDLVEIQI